MIRVSHRFLARAARHMNGLNFQLYSPDVCDQLDFYIMENGYQSTFWIFEGDLRALKKQYELKMKVDAEPHIIFQSRPSRKYIRLYNSEQFEYPCFSEVWGFMVPDEED